MKITACFPYPEIENKIHLQGADSGLTKWGVQSRREVRRNMHGYSASDSAGLSLTMCALQIYLLTYLVTYIEMTKPSREEPMVRGFLHPKQTATHPSTNRAR